MDTVTALIITTEYAGEHVNTPSEQTTFKKGEYEFERLAWHMCGHVYYFWLPAGLANRESPSFCIEELITVYVTHHKKSLV